MFKCIPIILLLLPVDFVLILSICQASRCKAMLTSALKLRFPHVCSETYSQKKRGFNPSAEFSIVILLLVTQIMLFATQIILRKESTLSEILSCLNRENLEPLNRPRFNCALISFCYRLISLHHFVVIFCDTTYKIIFFVGHSSPDLSSYQPECDRQLQSRTAFKNMHDIKKYTVVLFMADTPTMPLPVLLDSGRSNIARRKAALRENASPERCR